MTKPETTPAGPRKEQGPALHLVVRRRWFEEIASGRKRIEYRRRCAHWDRRLSGRRYSQAIISLGYRADRPRLAARVLGIRRSPTHWEIHLGEVTALPPGPARSSP